MSKSFQASFFPTAVGTTASNPPIKNPIVLACTTADAAVIIPSGWYQLVVQGNDMYIQMNAVTGPTTSPAIPKGVWPEPIFLGSKSQSGGAAAPTLTLHAATVSGAGILSLIPLDPISTP